ncbi:hypothetical protein KI387_012456, partial [Taxus chinensis]
LELLDEKRIRALNHLKVYQNKVSRGYNKWIIHWEFDVGDLVLKENQKNTIKDREKK